jgi:hypothetical protein
MLDTAPFTGSSCAKFATPMGSSVGGEEGLMIPFASISPPTFARARKKSEGELNFDVKLRFLREKHGFSRIIKYRLSSALSQNRGEIWMKKRNLRSW